MGEAAAIKGQSYDARIYTVCAPWKGERGDNFLNVFKPAFLNGLDGISDDYNSLREHLEGDDYGGNGVGGLAHAGTANEIRKSRQAYNNREL